MHLEPANDAKYGYLTVRATITKNSKSRNVPLSARVLAMRNGKNPAENGYVFHWYPPRRVRCRRLHYNETDGSQQRNCVWAVRPPVARIGGARSRDQVMLL